jgi:hypothetical protein
MLLKAGEGVSRREWVWQEATAAQIDPAAMSEDVLIAAHPIIVERLIRRFAAPIGVGPIGWL